MKMRLTRQGGRDTTGGVEEKRVVFPIGLSVMETGVVDV